MVTSYLLPVQTAAAVFPLVALVLFLPTAVVLHRRHGVMSGWRTLSLCAFGYYLLTAACLTAVPLPRRTADMCERYAAMAQPEWTPGHTVTDIWREAGDTITPHTLVLENPAVAGALFNLLLLLPLGVFLRHHARRGPVAAGAIGFGVSLLFEVTQGTGLWGVYPCPYRLFDVDDLLTNTAGTLLGWLLAGPLSRQLPSMATLDGRILARRPITVGRRLTALAVDATGVALLVLLTAGVAELDGGLSAADALRIPAVLLVAWFVLVPWLTGATPGKRLLRLELVTADGGRRPPLWRLAVRALPAGLLLAPPLVCGAVLGVQVLARPSAWGSPADARAAGAGDLSALAVHVLLAEPQLLLLLGVPAAAGLLVWHRGGGRGLHERLSGVHHTVRPGSPGAPPAPGTPAEPGEPGEPGEPVPPVRPAEPEQPEQPGRTPRAPERDEVPSLTR